MLSLANALLPATPIIYLQKGLIFPKMGTNLTFCFISDTQVFLVLSHVVGQINGIIYCV